jgi:hypothetical protein
MPFSGMHRLLAATTTPAATSTAATTTMAVALVAFVRAETALAGRRRRKREVRPFGTVVIKHRAAVVL